MRFNTRLQPKEREIIKQSALIQLKSVKRLISENSQADTTLFCLQNEVDKDEMKDIMMDELNRFKSLYRNPRKFLNMRDEDISTLIHIMENYITQESLMEYKSHIWRKLNLKEKFLFNAN